MTILNPLRFNFGTGSCRAIMLAGLAAVLFNGTSIADQNSSQPQNNDPLAPTSSIEEAVTSPLTAVTLVTANAARATNFYEKGMGMSCQSGTLGAEQATLWHVDDVSQWSLQLCDRPNTEDEVIVRVLSSAKAGPDVRDDFSARRNGILSLGFAIQDMPSHVTTMKTLDVEPNAGITTITLPNASGGTYVVEETHYQGPNNGYMLGISRPEGYDPIAQLDAETGLGGPAYSGVMVDDPDAFKKFMTDVMGYEARRDIEVPSSGPGGGLGLAKGTILRFVQMFSPGSTTGYVIVLGVGDQRLPATATPRPPNQGLTMLSFTSKKFDELLRRAKSMSVESLLTSENQEGLRQATFVAPNGILIEVVEQRGS